jgi:hypothetical protein
MPPQKNSGAKASKRVSGVEAKNSRFIQAYLGDLHRDGKADDVYVARVIARLGNGRMDVFYLDKYGSPNTTQAVIRGSFRGKGKRSVWVDIGSIVMIGDSGIAGSAEFEIMAILSQDDLNSLRRETTIDPRILDITKVDKEQLKSSTCPVADGGFEFDASEDVDIEGI